MVNFKAPEICLIVPPSRSYSQRLPIGLMMISSYLSSKGEKNEILDYKGINREEAYKKVKEKILENKPKFVGITCIISEMELVKDLCKFIRKHSENTKITIGGPYPTICPHHFLENIDFDYLVIGEGEVTFYDLISALRTKKDINQVKGIAYIKSGKLKFTSPRELIQDLDSLPFPAYDKVDMDYYCRPNTWAIKPVFISGFNLYTSRGCPFNCNFCVEHTIFGRKVRFWSTQRAVEHIEYVMKTYKIDALYIMDECFTASKKRVYEIFDLLKKKNIKLLFGCTTRVDLLDEKLLKFMKENGCFQIDLGIESGSNRMLKVMNKRTNVKMINEVVKMCKKFKIRVLANMIFNLPQEELKDIKMSLDLVQKLKCNLVIWNVFTAYPGVGFEGKTLDIEDLNLISRTATPSETTFDLLESKYKFGRYKTPLKEVLDYLYSNTFCPASIKLTPNLNYWLSFFHVMSFIFDYRYLFRLLKSKRKIQYVTHLFKQKSYA